MSRRKKYAPCGSSDCVHYEEHPEELSDVCVMCKRAYYDRYDKKVENDESRKSDSKENQEKES